MKRFLVFYGAEYYPAGGMDDLAGDFETKEAAVQFAEEKINQNSYSTWANVYDLE